MMFASIDHICRWEKQIVRPVGDTVFLLSKRIGYIILILIDLQ